MEINSEAKTLADHASHLGKMALTQSQSVSITSSSSYETASSVLREVRSQKDQVDAKRKSFVDPLNKVVRELNSLFKPSLDYLSNAEKCLKRNMTDFREKCRKEKEEKLQLAATAAKQKDFSSFNSHMGSVSDLAVPALKNVSFRLNWRFEVSDLSQVPTEFLCLDEAKVRKFLSTTKGETPIRGLRIFSEESPIIRKGSG